MKVNGNWAMMPRPNSLHIRSRLLRAHWAQFPCQLIYKGHQQTRFLLLLVNLAHRHRLGRYWMRLSQVTTTEGKGVMDGHRKHQLSSVRLGRKMWMQGIFWHHCLSCLVKPFSLLHLRWQRLFFFEAGGFVGVQCVHEITFLQEDGSSTVTLCFEEGIFCFCSLLSLFFLCFSFIFFVRLFLLLYKDWYGRDDILSWLH